MKRVCVFIDNKKSVKKFMTGDFSKSILKENTCQISDENDNEYSLPLEENKVYSDLKVIFGRKILGEELLFCEKVGFKRVSPLEVEMRVLESEFL